MRYGEYKQYLLVKKSFTVRFQRQIYLFTIKTTNKHFIFSLNIAKIAHLSFSLPDKIISPRRSAPESPQLFEKSPPLFANSSLLFRQTSPLSVSHPQVSRSPCSIANETTPQFTTFGYSSGTKSRKRRKNAPHACQKGLSIYLKWVLPCLAKAFNFAS